MFSNISDHVGNSWQLGSIQSQWCPITSLHPHSPWLEPALYQFTAPLVHCFCHDYHHAFHCAPCKQPAASVHTCCSDHCYLIVIVSGSVITMVQRFCFYLRTRERGGNGEYIRERGSIRASIGCDWKCIENVFLKQFILLWVKIGWRCRSHCILMLHYVNVKNTVYF